MKSPILATLLAGCVLLPAAALAAEQGRYSMSPVEGGFVRLDTQTGAMSLCRRSGAGEGADAWSCEPMAESDNVLSEEIERLRKENAQLKDDVRRMEDEFVIGRRNGDEPLAGPPGGGPPGGGPPGGPLPKLELPSEEDVDRAVDYLEGMIRKFRERFENFGDKTKPRDETPPGGAPDEPPRGDRGDRQL